MDTHFSAPALRDTLAAAARAADAATLQRVDAQLDVWETQSAYWEALLAVALDALGNTRGEVPFDTYVNARRLAMIRFKNGISKYWRARIVNRVAVTISREAKARIRTRLLDVLHEPDRAVAVQAAVAIARIARLDYPGEWPELVPTLQDALVQAAAAVHAAAESRTLAHSAAPTLTLLHAADVLRQCLKEFESVRVLAGKMRMTEMARGLLPVLQPVYEQLFQDTFSHDVAAAWISAPGTAERVRASHLLLKVLHRLSLADTGVVAARVDASRPNLAYSFFLCTPPQLGATAALRDELVRTHMDAPVLAPLTKHMVAFAKFHLALVAKLHSNVATWPGWADVASWYWGVVRSTAAAADSVPTRDADSPLCPYRWLVLALVLLRTTFAAWKRNRPADSAFVGVPGAHFELEAVDVLVGTYLRLTPADLARWEASPEEFAMDEVQADPDLDVRPAAERLLMVLSQWSLRSGKDGVDPYALPTVAELVWVRFEQAASLPTDTLDAVLARDAVYTAAGRCRDQLDPEIMDNEPGIVPERGPDSVDRLGIAVHTRLVPEGNFAAVCPAWVVMRRRIAWLLWEWSEFVRDEARPGAYALLVRLLSDPDAAVQLAATRTLAALADTLDFDADGFTPFLGDALAALIRLVDKLDELDSIRTVASTLSVVIERVGPRIVPYAARLADMIPSLWAVDDPQARTRPSILEFLDKLVASTAPSLSDNALLGHMHALVAHIVRESVAPALAPLLGIDGLMLWLHTMQASHSMTPVLFALLDVAPPLFSQPDYCSTLGHIWEEYVVMAPRDALQHYGSAMCSALAEVLGDPESPVVLAPLYALEAHVRALAALHDTDALRVLAELLHTTRLTAALFATVQREESAAIAAQFAYVVSRLAFALPAPLFVELARADAPGGPAALIPPLAKRVENMASLRKRKMVALALAALLRSSHDPAVLAAVPTMVGVWTDMLGEVVENDDGSSVLYEREESPDPTFDEPDEWGDLFAPLEDQSPMVERNTQLRASDPITNVPLRAYLADTLNGVMAAHGPHTPAGAALHSAIAGMDPLVLDVFQRDLQATQK